MQRVKMKEIEGSVTHAGTGADHRQCQRPDEVIQSTSAAFAKGPN